MALPGDELASTAAPADLLPPDDLGRPAPTTDYELGGVALNDPSDGLDARTWRLMVVGDEVRVSADPYATEEVLFTQAGIVQASLAFDQNMAPVVAFVTGSGPFLWWYDPTLSAHTFTALAADVSGPVVCMDDKRDIATRLGTNDVLLLYTRGASLYYRQQRERYGVERLLATFVGPRISISKAGMNAGNRMQVEVVGLDNILL